eukprot:TRINITY_DN394_c0_g4_i1.p1 TRINITY_DN394_c0_g4~~TRINITY_DN394_c0_g4_i1.p1  ORF type:complete len:614 (+),score=106.88 TRINITY_DN394_c0_g4_i1:27-1868(+)
MQRIRQVFNVLKNSLPGKGRIVKIGMTSAISIGVLYRLCERTGKLPASLRFRSDSTVQIPLDKNTQVQAIKVKLNNLKELRKPGFRQTKFIQFVNDSSKVNPHYFYYRKTLSMRKRNLPNLYLVNFNQWQPEEKAALFKTLGLNERSNNALDYVLIDAKGNVLCSTSETPIDPVRHGMAFLEGPAVVRNEESLLSAFEGSDEYEHTFFVIYDNGRRNPLTNCFYKAFAELSYNLQQACSFITIRSSKVAKEIGVDDMEPGTIYVLHTLSKLNTSSFPQKDFVTMGGHSFAVTKCPLFDSDKRAEILSRQQTADEVNELFSTLKEYIIQALCYQRKVQYCPNVDYLRVYLSLYKYKRDKVLYISVNPSLISMDDFELLYDNLTELKEVQEDVRIVLTDTPSAASYSWILPAANEKMTIRYIDYSRVYQRKGGKPIFGDPLKLEKAKGKANYIEKYRMESKEVPSVEALKEFLKDCKERRIEPYNETDIESPKLHRLTSANYEKILKQSIRKDRIILCYCSRCAKCKQVLDTINNNPELAEKIYTYNVANESDLNSWIKAAPCLAYVPKDSMVPVRIRLLMSVVVGKNVDREIAEAVSSLSSCEIKLSVLIVIVN